MLIKSKNHWTSNVLISPRSIFLILNQKPARRKLICEFFVVCHIDGNWGEWSEFSECSVTCGHGVHIRNRFCQNPKKSGTGKYCSMDGSSGIETKPCYQRKCWTSKYATLLIFLVVKSFPFLSRNVDRSICSIVHLTELKILENTKFFWIQLQDL